MKKTEVKFFQKQTLPFFPSPPLYTAESFRNSTLINTSVSFIIFHIHLIETTTLTINTPFCFFSFIYMIPFSFFFLASLLTSPTHSFFSKGKQSISVPHYTHCMSRLADNFLLFCFIRGKKREQKKNGEEEKEEKD